MSEIYVNVDELNDSILHLKMGTLMGNPLEAYMDALKNVKLGGVLMLVRCKDCKFWEKQDHSLQGRCALHKEYPTGMYYCADGVEKK